MTRKKFTIFVIQLTIILSLACGVSTLPTQANTPAPTEKPISATLRKEQTAPSRILTITGCWNLRSTPKDAGTDNDIGEVCNQNVSIESMMIVGGYIQTPTGWLCGRAFGMDVSCE